MVARSLSCDGGNGFVTDDDHFCRNGGEPSTGPSAAGGDAAEGAGVSAGCSWDAVFERVSAGYETALQ
jgi:phosphatidylinositol alpha 1,6-mannosyltransferase